MTAQPTSLDLNKSMMSLRNGNKTSQYLEVKWRLLWFREVCPAGKIETRLVHLDVETEFSEDILEWSEEDRKKVKVGEKTEKGYAVFQATVTDDKGNVATGTKMERAVSFPDFLEKAETGAIGRALAALGYGTQFVGDEMSEGRIVDSPVASPERKIQQGTQPQGRAEVSQQAPTPLIPSLNQLISLADRQYPGQFLALKMAMIEHGLPQDAQTWSEGQRSQAYGELKLKAKKKTS